VDVYSFSGQFAGTVSNDGAITNASGKRLGRVDPDGQIWNQYNSPAGQVHPWYDSVILVGESGADLARVNVDGSIYRIWSEGDPYFIGRAESPSPPYLAGAAALLLVRTDIFHEGGPQAPQRITPIGEKYADRY
jgi:hypothetical protein